MTYTWPTELDASQSLLALVGSFWSELYAGSDVVESILYAKAQEQAQAQLELYDLLASFSRYNVPVFKTENWSLLLLQESKLNSTNLPIWDGTYKFDGSIFFDVPATSELFSWPMPETAVEVKVISDRITSANLTMTRGTDFEITRGAVTFKSNPFNHPSAVPVQVFENGLPVDRLLYLWMYNAKFDIDTVYQQFGYVLGLKLASSQTYKDIVNAVYDGLVDGTNARCVELFMSAVCDVPLSKESETVAYVLTDATRKWVITDKNAYGFAPTSQVVVSPGDVVNEGDPLTDTLVFYDFNRGAVPGVIKALALGSGLLASGYFGDLVFSNETVPLVVTENVNGYTKVEFEISGWPADVEKFWEDVHSNGVAKNDTLAMRLDTRTNKTGQPTAIALPATINPLQFLIQNIYRGNAFAIYVKPSQFGPAAIGLHAARYLRKLIPPQTLCLVIVETVIDGDVITLDGTGDETHPGYEEELDVFLGNTTDDEIDPEDYVSEDVRIHQINGYCL